MSDETRIVHSDSEILGGTPVFVGTPVPVKTSSTILRLATPSTSFFEAFPRSPVCKLLLPLNWRAQRPKRRRVFAMTDRKAEPEVLLVDDEMGRDEPAELLASLDRALEDSDAGRGMDAWEYLEHRRLVERDTK